MKKLMVTILLCILVSSPAFAQDSSSAYGQFPPPAQEEFTVATVLSIQEERTEEVYGFHRMIQTVRLQLKSGPEKGKEFTIENAVLNQRKDMLLSPGEEVVVLQQTHADGSVQYVVREKYRLPAMLWLVVLFIGMTILFGGMTGLTSLAGLFASVVVLIAYVIPRIVAGDDPLFTSIIGSTVIACTSLYLAHGFSKRTSIALLSTIITLACSTIIAVLFVHVARLFGMGSEETVFLQAGLLENVNLRGLLLGGMIIGSLGVLDDVTTAQTAAIDEISKANPKMSLASLRAAGRSVGREHIASLINTLALAYVGASLPLLLLFETQGEYPLWVTLNGEFLAEEIIRTLVGSMTLVFAVPISTALAAYFLQGGRGGTGSLGHSHVH